MLFTALKQSLRISHTSSLPLCLFHVKDHHLGKQISFSFGARRCRSLIDCSPMQGLASQIWHQGNGFSSQIHFQDYLCQLPAICAVLLLFFYLYRWVVTGQNILPLWQIYNFFDFTSYSFVLFWPDLCKLALIVCCVNWDWCQFKRKAFFFGLNL